MVLSADGRTDDRHRVITVAVELKWYLLPESIFYLYLFFDEYYCMIVKYGY